MQNEGPDQEKVYQSEDVSGTLTLSEGCSASLSIEMTPAVAGKEFRKALKEINKEVSLPGFRKGRVPEAMLMKKYGKYIDEQWRENLVNKGVKEIIRLSEVYPIGDFTKPQFQHLSKEEGARFTTSYEHYPIVPEIDLSSLNIQAPEAKAVTEEDIDKRIEEIRKMHANWEEVTDRAVMEGDVIMLDIDALEDPVRSLYRDQDFEVSKENMGEWMRNLVIGLKIGESIEGQSELEPDASEEMRKKFQPTSCRITVKKIQTRVLPDVDEALLKKLEYDSVDALRKRAREEVEKEEQLEANSILKDLIEDALLEKYNFDIPRTAVEAEREQRIRKRIQELKSSNASDEEILNQEENIEEEVAEEVSKAVRLYYISDKIAMDHQIRVSREELSQAVSLHMMMLGLNPADVSKDQKQLKDLVSHLEHLLLTEKVREHMVKEFQAPAASES